MNIIVGIGQGKKVIGGVKIVNRDRVTIIGENIEITPINPGIAKATTAILIIIKQEGAEVDQIKGIINQCLILANPTMEVMILIIDLNNITKQTSMKPTHKSKSNNQSKNLDWPLETIKSNLTQKCFRPSGTYQQVNKNNWLNRHIPMKRSMSVY